MSGDKILLFYGSATFATLGTILYHSLAKRIPVSIDPLVSVIGTYAIILVLSFAILPFTLDRATWGGHFRQLGWVQIGLAVAIIMIELGFILMYRSGWDLSLGNVVTSVVINLALLAIGVSLFAETISIINLAGVLLSIAGVAMIAWKG